MRPSDALRKVAETISRKKNAAAVVVPRKIAVVLADAMYQPMNDDFLDVPIDRARAKYMQLVEQGGYIGTIMNMPMVVAEDVVICSMTQQELQDSASRLGVNLAELQRDLMRVGVA